MPFLSPSQDIIETPTLTSRLKVAIYCRLSEEDKGKLSREEDSASIQNQKSMLLQYVAEQGWTLYRIYSDDDYAGADRNRPAFNQLLLDGEQKKFDLVLCKTQSRFTRELELVEKYIHNLFPQWGIRFVSVVDNADTANKGNKKSRQINGLVNEWYLEDMSESIRSVLDNRRANGLHIGSFALYGYRKDPENKGHLVIDEEAADVVRKVFTLFAQGYGKTAIARMLNDQGIPNPTEYKRLQGLRYHPPSSKHASLWKYSSIASMLQNEIYTGKMVQGKYGSVSYKTKQNKPRPKAEWYVVPHTHEPIIDAVLWDCVQKLRKEKAKPFSTGTIGLFSQKVRCQNCGYLLRSSKSHGNYYLQCPTRYIAKESCSGAFLSVKQLEKAVLTELNRLAKDYLDADDIHAYLDSLDAGKNKILKMENEIDNYQKKIAETTRIIQELYRDKARRRISEDDFFTLSQEFYTEKDRLQGELLAKQEESVALQMANATEEDACSEVHSIPQIEHLTREMVEIFVDYIAVGTRIPETQQVPIQIHWNF